MNKEQATKAAPMRCACQPQFTIANDQRVYEILLDSLDGETARYMV